MASNMIPYLSPLTHARTLLPELYSEMLDRNEYDNYFSKNRGSIIAALMDVPAFAKVLDSMKQDGLYQVILSPQNVKQFKPNAANVYSGVVRQSNGSILEHLKLIKAGPDLTTALTACAAQVLLTSIFIELEQIEKGINQIKKYLHNDRIAEINSGINQFEQALSMDIEHQQGAIQHAVQSLNNGISSVVKSLPDQLDEIPEQLFSIRVWRIAPGNGRTKKKIDLAEESLFTTIYGLQALCDCLAVISQPKAAATALNKYINDLNNVCTDEVVDKIRLVPHIKGARALDTPWVAFRTRVPHVRQAVAELAALEEKPQEYLIECKPRELIACM